MIMSHSNESEFQRNNISKFRCATTVATDGKYLYIHSVDHGLIKMDIDESNMGKIVCKKEYKMGIRCSILYFRGKLYLRQTDGKPTVGPSGQDVPFVVINPNDFEDMQNGENSTNTPAEDAKKTLMYVLNDQRDRLLRRSTMFTDGSYLYVLTMRPKNPSCKSFFNLCDIFI